MSNSQTVLDSALRELFGYEQDADRLGEDAKATLKEVRPLLIGKRVRTYGRDYVLKQVEVRRNAAVTCYGLRINKRGKVGTRGFDIGELSKMKFLDE